MTASSFVVIPAYNEGPVLQETIDSLLSLPENFAVVVVDDGSDSPLEIIPGNRVSVIRHSVNLGQGAAIQTGMDFALKKSAERIFTFDADGQHSVEDILLMEQVLLKDEADIVLGSRFLGTAVKLSFTRRMFLQIARGLNFLLTGLWMTDAHNGIRGMNRLAASSIRLTENRMAHATEFLFEIKARHLRWKEVPVTIHYTAYSLGKGQRNRHAIKLFFDVVLHKLFR
jgi:glycosyltransferase involved in cell wall biosynthesis